MNRLFIALKIPDEIREKIINLRNEAFPNFQKYKWESEDKIHLTLKFIGEVREELTQQIADQISFIEGYKKFNCSLTNFGFFYKQNDAKILWIGLSINNRIIELVSKLNIELEKFSIPREKRKFQAHITIKRLKGDEGNYFINSFEKFRIPRIEFEAGQVILMNSDLLPTGSKYAEIKSYLLK